MINYVYVDSRTGRAYSKKGYTNYLKKAREDARVQLTERIEELQSFTNSLKAVMNCSSTIKTIELTIEDDDALESGIRAYLSYGVDIPEDLQITIKDHNIRVRFPASCIRAIDKSFAKTVERMNEARVNIAADKRFELPKFMLVE